MLTTNTTTTDMGVYYYHADHIGSASTVTDTTGKFTEHCEYFPYGEVWISESANTTVTANLPFKFTSKELDAETGFYYYGARYMDPRLGRFISTDAYFVKYLPTGNKEGDANLPGEGGIFNSVNVDLYHYAGENPVKYTDPDGNFFNLFRWVKSLAYNKSDFYSQSITAVSPDSSIKYQFNRTGLGFKNAPGQNNRWGKNATVETLMKTAKSWYVWNGNDNPIYLNDFSTMGGSPGHHSDGMSVDIKWMSTDGKFHSGSYDTNATYDREKTIDLIQTIIDKAPSGFEAEAIFFNDPAVIAHFNGVKNSNGVNVVRRLDGHDDHVHAQIKKLRN